MSNSNLERKVFILAYSSQMDSYPLCWGGVVGHGGRSRKLGNHISLPVTKQEELG